MYSILFLFACHKYQKIMINLKKIKKINLKLTKRILLSSSNLSTALPSVKLIQFSTTALPCKTHFFVYNRTSGEVSMQSLEAQQNSDAEMQEDSDMNEEEAELSNDDIVAVKPKKKRKKGIIYISNIPKHMNVTRLREILGEYGKLGRVYLQPEKLPGDQNKKKKHRKVMHYTEGWVEFDSKRIAKQIVPLLNNKHISTRKKSQFYDYLWSMKYLPRFKWTHLTERMNYEQAVHKQRLTTEVSQARKETHFFQNNLDRSEHLKKKAKMEQKLANKKSAAAQ